MAMRANPEYVQLGSNAHACGRALQVSIVVPPSGQFWTHGLEGGQIVRPAHLASAHSTDTQQGTSLPMMMIFAFPPDSFGGSGKKHLGCERSVSLASSGYRVFKQLEEDTLLREQYGHSIWRSVRRFTACVKMCVGSWLHLHTSFRFDP